MTTPQDIALLDARKALKMFEKVEIPVLGVVENMSTHICSQCGHEEAIFGQGGGHRMAEEHSVDVLGGIPLEMRIREDADSGRPTVVADPDGKATAKILSGLLCRSAPALSRTNSAVAKKSGGVISHGRLLRRRPSIPAVQLCRKSGDI